MKLSTKRKIYYTSVVFALVAILGSAVVINRTLVNTPEFDIEEISSEAGEPVSVYMAYVDENGDAVVGIAEQDEEEFGELVSFVRGVPLSDPIEEEESSRKTLSAWVVLYDEQNRIASRMNFYDNGGLMWYDGKSYTGSADVMNTLIEYCNKAAEDGEEEKTTDVEASEEEND